MKVFISYARDNKPHVDQLVEHLGILGSQTWVDSSLRGGQDWWEEILRRIADCDAFLAIISREALNSVACRREFDWADALGKPVLPVAVEPPPSALPRRFSRRQIIDYSEPGHRDRAALTLAGGLAALPPAPPLPQPLPEPPAAPLSYLTDLVDLVSQPNTLDHQQQRQILRQLEVALRSVDPEERRGARDIMELFSSREDLYADVDRTITQLTRLNEQRGPTTKTEPRSDPPKSPEADLTTETEPRPQSPTANPLVPDPASTPVSGPQPPDITNARSRSVDTPNNPKTAIPGTHGDSETVAAQGALHPPGTPAATQARRESISEPKSEKTPESRPKHPLTSSFGQSRHFTPGTLIAIAAIAGLIPFIANFISDSGAPRQIWYFQTMMWILIAISFSTMAVRAKSHSDKATMISGWLTVTAMLLTALLYIVLFEWDLSWDLSHLLINVWTILNVSSSLLAVAFGVAVNRSKRVGWASLLIIWGLWAMVTGVTGYIAPDAPTALFILEPMILLAVGILMYRESRLSKNEPAAAST